MLMKDIDLFKGVYNLYSMFDYYNQIVFNNEIKPLHLEWTQNLQQCAGICIYTGTRKGFMQAPIRIRLSIQLLAYRSEYDVTNVLVHEMMHAVLFQRGVFEENAHGPIWMGLANRANQYFGLKITQYHYHIDRAQYRILTDEQKSRVKQCFIGKGNALGSDLIIDLTKEDSNVDDCVIVDIEDDQGEVISLSESSVISIE